MEDPELLLDGLSRQSIQPLQWTTQIYTLVKNKKPTGAEKTKQVKTQVQASSNSSSKKGSLRIIEKHHLRRPSLHLPNIFEQMTPIQYQFTNFLYEITPS